MRVLRGSGGGVMVNVASTSPFVSSAGQSVYEIFKAGVHMLTRSLALEMVPFGNPGERGRALLIDTEMTRSLFGNPERFDVRVKEEVSLGTPRRPEDVAQAVVFLASDDAGYLLGGASGRSTAVGCSPEADGIRRRS